MAETALLYHPSLDRVIEVPDDADMIAVHEEAGWERREPPKATNPALAPGETETQPEAGLEDTGPAERPKRRSKPDTKTDT